MIAGEWQQWDANWQRWRGSDYQCLFRPRGEALQDRSALQLRAYADWLLGDLEQLEARGPLDILELGAGRGTVSQYLAEAGHRTTLADRSQVGLDMAVENYERFQMQPPDVVHTDAQGTELPDASFDCVFSIGLLEHFDQPQSVLAESLRLLRSGGEAWHVIVNACPLRPETEHMTRTAYTPTQYLAWLAELGHASASCIELPYESVLLLRCTK